MDKFENKLFEDNRLRHIGMQKLFGKDVGASRMYHLSQNESLDVEQAMLDVMGEEGWFPAGWRLVGPQKKLFLIFSRIKDEDDSGKV